MLALFEREEATPGTPLEEPEDVETVDLVHDTNEHIYEDIDRVNVGNVVKAHNGGITTVNVFDVKYCTEKGTFRCSISDGFKFSTNVFFDPKISEDVEKDLVDKVSIVKLEIVEIIQKCVVIVSKYTRFEDGPRNMGGAQFVGESFYRKYKARGYLTPSCMRTKFF